MLPQLDGYGVCEKQRDRTSMPILMLSAIDGVSQKIACLQLGAADYVVKLVSPKELIARICCLLRRRAGRARTRRSRPPICWSPLICGSIATAPKRQRMLPGRRLGNQPLNITLPRYGNYHRDVLASFPPSQSGGFRVSGSLPPEAAQKIWYGLILVGGFELVRVIGTIAAAMLATGSIEAIVLENK